MTAVSAIELHKAQPETQAPVLLARKMVCASKEFRAELSGGREDANAMDADEAFLVILVSTQNGHLHVAKTLYESVWVVGFCNG